MNKKKILIISGLLIILILAIILIINNNTIVYDVSFDTDGGSIIFNQGVKKGNKVEKPNNPTKDGYIFVEWVYEDETYDFDLEVTSNLTLTAKWEEDVEKFTISFDTDGGSIILDQIVKKGDKVERPNDPTKAGYVFKEWTLDGYAYNFDTIVEDNFKLVARWEKIYYNNSINENEQSNVKQYTVYFDSDGGSEVPSQTVNEESKITQPADPTKAGYIFIGWMLNDNLYDFDTVITEDITIKAKWQIIEYTILYNLNDGDNENFSSPITYTIEDEVIIKNPTRDGAKFIGWTGSNGDIPEKDLIIKKGTVGNLSFEANWKLPDIKVVFKDLDGTILSEELYYYNDVIIIPNVEDKENTSLYTYEFVGWDKEIGPATEDVVYTAVYDLIINIDTLVDCTFNTIKDKVPVDKFEISKENSIIKVLLKDLNVNSTSVLEGTGIASAIQDIFKVDGVESITLSIPEIEGAEVIISENNLDEKLIELYALLNVLTGSNTTTSGLIGKVLNFTINLEDGYKTNDNNTFSIKFLAILDTEKIIQDAYNIINESSSENNFKYNLNNNIIKVTIVNLNSNAIIELNNMNIIDAIEKMLLNPAIRSVTLSDNLNDNDVLITNENISLKKADIESLFSNFAGSSDASLENLSGKLLELSFELEEGYVSSGVCKLVISFGNIYNVSYNVDGNITTIKVQENEIINEPSTPIKEGFTFLYWELNGEKYDFSLPVTKDIELVAVWQINSYEVSFVVNDNKFGSIDKTSLVVEYGSLISVNGNQITIGDNIVTATATSDNDQYTYYFDGFSGIPKDNAIVSDITITCNFIQKIKEYTVTWDVNGTKINEIYKYGDTPSYKGSTEKEADNIYNYTFAGWDKEITVVTANVVYTAIYTSNMNEYTVIFKNEDGTVLSTSVYHYGDSIVVPSVPSKNSDVQYTYIFRGWDKEVTVVTGNVTYTAVFDAILNKYTITFVDSDGTVLSSKDYDYGSTVIEPSNLNPPANYAFAGWDKEITTVTCNQTYTAKYNYIVDVDNMINSKLSSINAETFDITKNDNNVNINFKSYSPSFLESLAGVDGKPPHSFLTLLPDVKKVLTALRTDEYYESVELYTLYPGSTSGRTIDLMDYDLNLPMTEWYGDGANDAITDWVGYLASGNPSASAAYDADSDDLVGKKVDIIITLKDGNQNVNGSSVIKYSLTFSSD